MMTMFDTERAHEILIKEGWKKKEDSNGPTYRYPSFSILINLEVNSSEGEASRICILLPDFGHKSSFYFSEAGLREAISSAPGADIEFRGRKG